MSDNSELNRLLQQKSKLTHDLKAKRLFSLKQVVARLLKECIPEYRDCQLEDIINTCLDPCIQTASANDCEDRYLAMPWTGSNEYVRCLNTEKVLPHDENALHLDLLFEAIPPKSMNKCSNMLIGIEIQNSIKNIENIVNRGIFYLSLMITTQYGDTVKAPAYDGLKPVCSIWICPSAPEELANRILTVEHNCSVQYSGSSRRFSTPKHPIHPPRLVIIMLNGDCPPERDICGFLWTLLSTTLSYKKKKNILIREYGMTETQELNTNLQDDWESFLNWYGHKNWAAKLKEKFKRGERKGRKQGRLEGMEEGRLEGMEEGRLEGMEKGRLLANLSFLEYLLNQGMNSDTIMKTMNIDAKQLQDMLAMRTMNGNSNT